MQFTVSKSALSSALASLSRVVERRNTIPILGNVAIKAGDGLLILTATDLDIELVMSIEADVATPGSTTVAANLLNDVVRKMSGDSVKFDLIEGKEAAVSSGRSKVKLHCLPAEDFPSMATGEFSHTFTIDCRAFWKNLKRTSFAASTEETRYYLNGVYIHTTESGDMVMVATDGHRLAKATMPAPSGSTGFKGVIIPRKTVGELMKLLDRDGTMEMSVSENKIKVASETLSMTSKLIDGTFPDYERVIPAATNTTAECTVSDLTGAVDRVAVISAERGRAVKFTFDGSTCGLLANNPDSGSAQDEIQVDYAGERLEIGMNARYVADIMGNIGTEKCRLHLIDAGAPIRIVPEGDDTFLAVLMPMRI